MSLRPTRATRPSPAKHGSLPLTLAKGMLWCESLLRYFVRPLVFSALFVALAWFGLFAQLYPWIHLVCLAVFIGLMGASLGQAVDHWKPPSESAIRRRVEEATGLRHRPLDVLDDRSTTVELLSQSLWQHHTERARQQTKTLKLPHWKRVFTKPDPYHLRPAFAVLMLVALVVGWGALGGRVIAALNPALGKMALTPVTLDAWISPPSYVHQPPIMIATPAGVRLQGDVIKVPEGSSLTAYIAEKDGDVPELEANGTVVPFTTEDGRDFGVTQILHNGDAITIKRGWRKLASWRVQVMPDTVPNVAFTEPPAATERGDMRLAFEAQDDHGVTGIALKITPRQPIFGLSNEPITLPLVASADDKNIKRTAYKDLTAEIWAGTPADLQLIVSDAVGHTAVSETKTITLPERAFFQPLARALVDERKKLITQLLDPQVRNEAANIMAGLARQPDSFGGDPVVAMALRAGAVRLVLDPSREGALSVKDLLWQSAERIEQGATGRAADNMRQAQQDLQDALDRNADEAEIQKLIDRLHQAVAQYLAQLATQSPPKADAHDLSRMIGVRTNVLTPQDLQQMLERVKDLSASGAREQAQEELARLQDVLENLQNASTELSPEDQATLDQIDKLDAVAEAQQDLLDDTFQNGQSGKASKGNSAKLAAAQQALQQRLSALAGANAELAKASDAMNRAAEQLKKGAPQSAMVPQNEALSSLRTASQKLKDGLQANLFAASSRGKGKGDPFGRLSGESADSRDAMHVPDATEAKRVRAIMNEIQRRSGDMSRPKTERDYIERLLQNF